jgi:hypothetical protein
MILLRTLLANLEKQGAGGMSITLCVSAFGPVIYPGLNAALRPGLPLMIAAFPRQCI